MAGELPQRPSVKVFDCSRCGAGVILRAQGQAISAACASCGAVMDTTDENYRIISTARAKTPIEPAIPLGTRGKLRGETWEVIGFMQRRDGSGMYSWREYLLFNPYRGFRWLVEADGHWNYVVMTKDKPPKKRGNTLLFRGFRYHLFNRGEAVVDYVVGEFYWRIQFGEKVKASDYVCPPYMFSCEESADEIIWSTGEYLEPEEIQKGFLLTQPMPPKVGVAPNQPMPGAHHSEFFRLWGFFVGALVLIEMLSSLFLAGGEVYRETLIHVMGRPGEKSMATRSFPVEGRTGNLRMEFVSPVNNSWVEIEGALVNDQDGAAEDFGGAIEYYTGYEGGEYWSEGSQQFTTIASGIPAGSYHLNLEINAPKPGESGGIPVGTEASLPVEVRVTRGVLIWSNFFLALLLVSAVPLWGWLRARSFETQRWSNSDFSPG